MENSSLASILAELGSETRLDILELLSKGPKRFSEIKKELKLTSPELVRQLGRLESVDLTEHHKDGRYGLSSFGNVVLSMIGGVEFLAEHVDYFRNHDTSFIPDFLMMQLEPRMNIQIVKEKFGPVAILTERADSIREYYWIMSDGIPKFLLPKAKKKLDEGVRFRCLYPREYFSQVKSHIGLEDIRRIHLRLIDRVPMVVSVNESFAYVCLPRISDDSIDRSLFMFGSDSKFKRWCQDLFEYYWSKAEPI